MIPHITKEQFAAVSPAKAELLEIFNKRIDEANAQPEPAQPHAELKAMYEQQVKNTAEGKAGGLKDFDWMYRSEEYPEWDDAGVPFFVPNYQYRCTPKPTCQVQFINGFESGEVITMTRESAKQLKIELGDTVDWQTPATWGDVNDFVMSGIYTYKLKAQPKIEMWCVNGVPIVPVGDGTFTYIEIAVQSFEDGRKLNKAIKALVTKELV